MKQPPRLCWRCLSRPRRASYDGIWPAVAFGQWTIWAALGKVAGIATPASRLACRRQSTAANGSRGSMPNEALRGLLVDILGDGHAPRPAPAPRNSSPRGGRERTGSRHVGHEGQSLLDSPIRRRLREMRTQAPAQAQVGPGASLGPAGTGHSSTPSAASLAELELESESLLEATSITASQDEPEVDNYSRRILGASEYHNHIVAGDLVELPAMVDKPPQLAMYVAHDEHDCHCFAQNGTWVRIKPTMIMFSVRNFVPIPQAELLKPYIGSRGAQPGEEVRDLPGNVPRDLAVPLIGPMVDFGRRSEACYRRFSTPLDNAHDAVAHETDVRFLTLAEIAETVYGQDLPPDQRSAAEMYALHKALTRPGSGFLVDPMAHRRSHLFEVRPKEETRLFQTVESWFRDYHEALLGPATDPALASAATSARRPPLTASRAAATRKNGPFGRFLDVARRLIVESRRLRTPTKMHTILSTPNSTPPDDDPTRPVRKIDTGVTFSDTDRILIRFIQAWAGVRQIGASTRASSLGSLILRATGMYDGYDLDQPTGYLFLQEIGVYTPWQNRHLISDRLHRPRSSRYSAAAAAAPPPVEGGGATRYDDLPDRMRGLRRDWGDTPVYCIDNEATGDPEDGFSVEIVDGPVPSYWLHTHIVHPTAFLAPSDPAALRAQRQGLSIYMPDAVYPMLPVDFLERHGRLDRDQPVLTFSTRVDRHGAVLERRVEAAVVRNVLFVNGPSMGKMMRTQAEGATHRSFRVGKKAPFYPRRKMQMAHDLPVARWDELQLVARLCRALRDRRVRALERPSFRLEQAWVTVYCGEAQTVADFEAHDGRRALFWQGDHTIRARARWWDSIAPEAVERETLALFWGELMILASQTAAHFCHERGLPAPFRGTVGVNRERVDAMPAHHQIIQDYAPHAIPHRTLNLDMYVRATSPARRYSDMMVHWQIDAALRHEAGAGAAAAAKGADRPALPFAAADIMGLLPWIGNRAQFLVNVQSRSRLHWLCLFLIRAVFQQQDASLPRILTCFVVESNAFRLRTLGCIKELQQMVVIQPVPGLTAPLSRVHDEFEVEIAHVDVYRNSIEVRPIRLIKRAEDQSELDVWRMTQVAW